jgi:hypothetical protein
VYLIRYKVLTPMGILEKSEEMVGFNVEVKTYEAYKGGHTVGLGKD